MVFLDPKSDIVFKKLFGDLSHKNILLSFLNSVLGRTPEEQIVDVVMNDPNNFPETQTSKTSIVDVRCTDQRGNQYIIEMQVMPQKDYAARAQYYSALGLSRQLAAREHYSKLVPVIFIGVLNFNLFQNQDYISSHRILDTKTLVCELRHLEFYFIELSKFDKHIDNIDTILDKWIYLLKHATELNQVPENMQESAFKDAFLVLAQTNWSQAELEAYDRYLDSIRSAESQLATAWEIGKEKGREEGRKEGREESMADVAKKMLGNYTNAEITALTGLDEAAIEQLKKDKK